MGKTLYKIELKAHSTSQKGNSNYISLNPNCNKANTAKKVFLYHTGVALDNIFWTASFVGRAGMAPLSITVMAPQAFAKRSASCSRCSSCQKETLPCKLRNSIYTGVKEIILWH